MKKSIQKSIIINKSINKSLDVFQRHLSIHGNDEFYFDLIKKMRMSDDVNFDNELESLKTQVADDDQAPLYLLEFLGSKFYPDFQDYPYVIMIQNHLSTNPSL